jgi:16S rRNA (guanine527-N7)-methyltransferase
MKPDVETNRDFTLALLEEGLLQLCFDNISNGDDETADGQEHFLEQVLTLLSLYIEEIELFNPAYGLVNVRDRYELVVKHIFDSLAPVSIFRPLMGETPSIADVGSGAGLPGIPLAVCMPHAEVTLIERMGRRVGFLRNTLAVLGLPNVRVEESEMEKMARKPAAANHFDLIVFRAFKPLKPAVLKGLFALLAPEGVIAAYKGRLQSIEEEMAEITRTAESASIGNWKALPLTVPFLNEERHLLLIQP